MSAPIIPNERDIHIFMDKYYVTSDGLIITKTKKAKHFPQKQPTI
jgi:hypothetical protein